MTGVAQIAETGASKKPDAEGFAVIRAKAGMTVSYGSRRLRGASRNHERPFDTNAPSSVAFYLRRLLRVRKEALAVCGSHRQGFFNSPEEGSSSVSARRSFRVVVAPSHLNLEQIAPQDDLAIKILPDVLFDRAHEVFRFLAEMGEDELFDACARGDLSRLF